MFSLCAAWAYETCNPGEYLKCWRNPDDYDNCTDCECMPCDEGETSDGNGVVYEDACHMTSDSHCYVPNCAGYTDECPSYFNPDYRCKLLNTVCPDGCGVYKVCNSTNNLIVYSSFVDGSCHMEGSVCYGNTRACSEFDVNVIGGIDNWTCRKGDQTGIADWTVNGDDGFWNVSACSCDGDIDAPSDGCSVGHMDYDLGQSTTESVTAKISYIQTKRYCKHCAAGYVPDAASAPYTEYTYTAHPRNWFSPNENTSWGAYGCKQILKPKYSVGCDVNFNSSYQNAVASCQASCPANMETLANGATGQSDCVPNNSTVYQDSTGSFKLGTTQCQ